MTQVPQDPDYARDFEPEQIAQGAHRQRVGGLWDTMGKLQLAFLVEQGMQPSDRLLDVACGSLRAGTHLVGYLDPGNYYGTDINQSLLDAGYDLELSPELQAKLPRENLRRVDRFECDFGVQFDFAIAQSLFTHVPLNHVRLCMYQVARHMRPGGRFYVTFDEAPRRLPLDGVIGANRPSPMFSERNIYWYYRSDLEWAASFSPWRFRYIGDWGHPRKQRMIELTRVRSDVAGTARRNVSAMRAAARRLPAPVKRAIRRAGAR